MNWYSRCVTLATLVAALSACRNRDALNPPAAEAENWSVTAWGEHFEVFPEVGPLVAGRAVDAHTHVTLLRDFSAATEGRVAIVLTDGSGRESVFEQSSPKRAGIFGVEVTPPSEGEFALSFRIRSGGSEEEIPAGRVRVGSASSPGALLEPPKPPNGPAHSSDEEGSSFLKEQQWKTEFATAWTRIERIHATVVGSARVVPAAGGEMILTAPVDSVLAASPWPHAGQQIEARTTIFRLLSRATSERSLSELEAEIASVEADLTIAKARTERLAELFRAGATSLDELERARSTELALSAKESALRRDLEIARGDGDARIGIALTAPWRGRIAEILVTPGQALAAGERLGRLIKTRPLWLELALRSSEADRVGRKLLGALLRRAGTPEPITLPASAVRIVSRVPVLDPETASVTVLLEIDEDADRLPIGSVIEVELLVPDERSGVAVPASALVDDGGETIVWEQLSGESFARRSVRVVAKSGGRVSVDGLSPGVRVVTQGGAALRRSTLLGSGAPEGHVH